MWPPTIRSVGLGRSSRIVQQCLRTGPIFQTCQPVSVAGYTHGSSFGSSRSTPSRGTRAWLTLAEPGRRYSLGYPARLSASPIGVRTLAPLDVVVIIAVLDHLALAVEAQHAHSRVGEFLPLLGPAGPPFGRGPAARDDRRAEPALDIGLGQEIVGEIAVHASPAQARLAEWGRPVHCSVGIQRGDGLDITLWPGTRPSLRLPAGGSPSIHTRD